MTKNKSNKTVLVIGIVALLGCVCLLVVGLVGYGFFAFNRSFPITKPIEAPFIGITPDTTPVVTRPPIESISGETLKLLETSIVPPNEPKELACHLEGKCNIPDVVATSAVPRVVGDTDKFWVTNVETNENTHVQATLHYITPHVYFWVQDGVPYDENEMKALVDKFENKIYPIDREFFGSEWTPGIDGDEHIYILYTRGLGFSIAGYFSSSDEIHPLAHEYSNAHEMFLFNADNTFLGEEFTYGVLAHEFQHMIHWNQDRNETSWMNEGFSEVAAFLNGYDPGGFDMLYINDPDLQLNDWPNDKYGTSPHYGASFLYLTYFLDRLGEDATKALVKDQANGFDSVDDVLREINATDPLTRQPITADDFFMDWAVTNYILDKSVGDGRYVYNNYAGANRASATDTVQTCPQSTLTRDVHQYGVDYIAIECQGDFTLSFKGSTVTGLLPVDPYSGKYAFWSNKGDESDMTLTHEFDLTQASGKIKMDFHTWYDIEPDYDYVYLEVSEDGETWQIITTPSGTSDDPSGNSYGWGYNDVTNGWIEESVDLSQYVGKKIFVRFEYVTDAAINGEGFLLDDVSIDALNYKSDFEADDGGWVANGFVRIQNVLPQTFRLALILSHDSSVQMIPVNPDQTAEIPVSLGASDSAYLVVTGTTRFTRESAAYQIEIR